MITAKKMINEIKNAKWFVRFKIEMHLVDILILEFQKYQII